LIEKNDVGGEKKKVPAGSAQIGKGEAPLPIVENRRKGKGKKSLTSPLERKKKEGYGIFYLGRKIDQEEKPAIQRHSTSIGAQRGGGRGRLFRGEEDKKEGGRSPRCLAEKGRRISFTAYIPLLMEKTE